MHYNRDITIMRTKYKISKVLSSNNVIILVARMVKDILICKENVFYGL